MIQLTTDPHVPGSHLYMEAQVFTMDSKRFVLHRSATAHGGSKHDPNHQYLLCHIEDDCELQPLTEETGATAPSVSPDGKFLYYFVDQTTVGGGRLTLQRVNLDGTRRETILVLDTPLPGTVVPAQRTLPALDDLVRREAAGDLRLPGRRPDRGGPLRADGVRPGARHRPPGAAGPDLVQPARRSTAARPTRPHSHDILVQENHGNVTTARGETTQLTGGAGADIHVIRDDGTDLRDMPWGRDGNEQCQGHQCWRGRSTWAITSTGRRQPAEAQLIEGRAAPHAGHLGSQTPGGVRNDLIRSVRQPRTSTTSRPTSPAGVSSATRARTTRGEDLPRRAGRAGSGPAPEPPLPAVSAVVVHEGRPHPPVPLPGRDDGLLQLRRVGDPAGVHDPGALTRTLWRRERRDPRPDPRKPINLSITPAPWPVRFTFHAPRPNRAGGYRTVEDRAGRPDGESWPRSPAG